jgi:hypothetical protein
LLSLPSLPGRKAFVGGAVALLAALAVAGPANAGTGVESTAGSTDSGALTRAFNFTFSWGASGVDSGSQDTGFTLIERKAG